MEQPLLETNQNECTLVCVVRKGLGNFDARECACARSLGAKVMFLCAEATHMPHDACLLTLEQQYSPKVYRLDQDAPARLLEVATLQEHDDIVSCVAASRSQDGLVLSGSHDRSINIWDIAGSRQASLDTFTGHSDGITGVKWAAGEDDNQIFASSSLDCSMRIWDRRQAQGCCACHWLRVPALSLAWEPSAQVLMVVGCEDGTLAVLDRRALSTPLSVQRAHAGRVNQTSFRPAAVGGDQGRTSPLLASVGDDGVLAVQALAEGSYHSRTTLHSDYVQALTWRDEDNLITGGWDSEICLVHLGQTDA